MLNLEHTLSDNFEVIIAAMDELNEYDELIGEKELKFLLFDTYDAIIPEFAKKDIRPAKFVLTCMDRSEELLKVLNRKQRLKLLSVV
jgi:hypothetical protein